MQNLNRKFEIVGSSTYNLNFIFDSNEGPYLSLDLWIEIYKLLKENKTNTIELYVPDSKKSAAFADELIQKLNTNPNYKIKRMDKVKEKQYFDLTLDFRNGLDHDEFKVVNLVQIRIGKPFVMEIVAQ